MTGTWGTSGPRPTTRSCNRNSVLKDPMIWLKVDHFGPWNSAVAGEADVGDAEDQPVGAAGQAIAWPDMALTIGA